MWEKIIFCVVRPDGVSKSQYLRNRKHFPCFHTVIETRVEVWENEKLKWEHEPVGRVFPRYFEFSQTSTSVSITYENTGKHVFYFFHKIIRRKLKRGNSLYRSVNSPYCSLWRMMVLLVYNGVNNSIFFIQL